MADRLQAMKRTSRRKAPLSKLHAAKITQNKRPSYDTKSDTSENQKQKHLQTRVENTYKMDPEERFDVAKMENLMNEILLNRLMDAVYDNETCSDLAKEIACLILSKSKLFPWKRYKLVAQVHIGQQDGQALRVASRCIWDASTDTYACVSYTNKSLFAVASCYGIYFE